MDIFLSNSPVSDLVPVNAHRPTKEPTPPKRSGTITGAALPFLVGLLETPNGQRFCEGTLISLMHVLTAAHCVRDGHAKWIAVHSSSGNSPEVIRIAEEKTVKHPSVGSPYKTSYDVAVLELEYASASGRPIMLDNSQDFADDSIATALVYDATETTTSNVVRAVELPMWSHDKCSTKMPNIDKSMVCAGGKAGQDTCQGDSGGPLVVTDENHQPYLAGMVSGGYKCGVEGVPGIYARVAEVASFIDAHVGVDHRWRFPRWKSQSNDVICRDCGDDERDGSLSSSHNRLPWTTSMPSTRPVVPRTSSSTTPVFKSSENTTATSREAGSSGVDRLGDPTTNPVRQPFMLPPGLPANVVRGVTDFVFGQQTDSWVRLFPTGMWQNLHDPNKSLVFLSSGNLTGMQQVIQQFVDRATHSGRATHQQRFGDSNWLQEHTSQVCMVKS